MTIHTRLIVVAIVLVVGSAVPSSGFSCGSERHETDYVDDSTGPQVHVWYVLPADGRDGRTDLDGRICRSVQAINGWLSRQTSGYGLRFDTYRGTLDITFARLSDSDEEMRSRGRRIVSRIELTLQARNLLAPTKIHAVFYGGSSKEVCGGAAYPPALPGRVAAFYLNDVDHEDAMSCDSGEPLDADSPGYTQFALLHDMMHVMGFVPTCAPHYGSEGHVDDNPLDLMYTGSRTWLPTVLDSGYDDYYAHGRSDCLDFARSPFLVRLEPSVRGLSVSVGMGRAHGAPKPGDTVKSGQGAHEMTRPAPHEPANGVSGRTK